MSNNQQLIEALETKKRVVDEEIKYLDDKAAKQENARILLKANADKSKARKTDNQRKFIIGAIILKEMQRNPIFKMQIAEFLNLKVTADRDRKILGLDDTKQTNKQTNK